MRMIISKEVPLSFKKHRALKFHYRIHRFPLPSVGEPDFYRAVTSYNAWCSGDRDKSQITDEERKNLQGGCCYNRRILYHTMTEEEWLWNCKSSSASGKIPYEPDLATFINHADIWAFYKAVGFDHKKRKYVQQEGK